MNIIRKLSKIWNYGIAKTVAACFAAHTSSLVVGLSQGYSAILIPQLMANGLNDMPMDNEEASWAASLGVISNPIGALIAGFLSEILGRKRTVQCCTIPFVTGWLTIALSSDIFTLYAGRFITGLAVGMITTTFTYIAEISPAKHRGVLSAFGPVVTSFGVVLIYILGYFLHWKTVALISIVISATTFIVMELVPESPPWLVSKNKIDRALDSLVWLRGNLTIAENDLKDLINKNVPNDTTTTTSKCGKTSENNVTNENVQNILNDCCKDPRSDSYGSETYSALNDSLTCRSCKCRITDDLKPNLVRKLDVSNGNGTDVGERYDACDILNEKRTNVDRMTGSESDSKPEQSLKRKEDASKDRNVQKNETVRETILDPNSLVDVDSEKHSDTSNSKFCSECVQENVKNYGTFSKPDRPDESECRKSDEAPYLISKEMCVGGSVQQNYTEESVEERPRNVFCSSKTYKPFVILILFFLFQELSGIYIILFYCVNFLHSLGTNFNDYIGTIIVGLIRFVASIFGAMLIRRYPRKMLAMTSGLGMASSLIVCGLYSKYYELYPHAERHYPWIPLVCILGSVCFSMCGFLQLPYVMNSELFPLRVRGIMGGVVISLANFFIFVSVKVYPNLLDALHLSGTLFLFGCASLVGAVYCILFLPETQNKSLSEIEASFESKKCKRIAVYDNRGYVAD